MHPTRWQVLLTAPHRLAFAAAMVVLAGSALWWAVALLASAAGLPLRWALPPALAHGLLMSLGFMPLFFTGFMFTAGPRWLRVAPVPARALRVPVLLQLGGWAGFGAGVHGAQAGQAQSWAALALAVVAVGWGTVGWRFLGLLRRSQEPDRVHAGWIAIGGAVGLLALGAASAGLWAGELAWPRAAMLASLWGFAGVVFSAAAHRMIPFLGAPAWAGMERWQPLWLLAAWLALMAFSALGAVLDALVPQALPPAWRWLQAGVELPAGLGLLVLALRWGRVQNLGLRLIAMLHAGVAWLGVAWALQGASHALAALGGQPLGLAPLHAYAMGFLGTVMLAMVSRVSAGQAGRTVAADDWLWRLFLLLQGVVLLRVGAALAAPWLSGGALAGLLAVAALGWAAVCVAWAGRYGRWYGQAPVESSQARRG